MHASRHFAATSDEVHEQKRQRQALRSIMDSAETAFSTARFGSIRFKPIENKAFVPCFMASFVKGTLTMPDGAVYEGQFKNGKKHGVAKCISCTASAPFALSA